MVGDDGCTSFDIALELGNKIESLKVANCQASSDEDITIITIITVITSVHTTNPKP